MVFVIMLINLVISFFNARNVGRVWEESKAVGGWIRVVVWSGAVMAAIGFTSFYTLVICWLGVTTGYLPREAVNIVHALTYVTIIVPLIGSGIIITIESWIRFAREKSLMNLGVAGWNTFAQGYNIYNAVNSFGGAWDVVSKSIGGLDKDDLDSNNNTVKAIMIAVFALAAGIITTVVIIRKYSATLPVSEAVREAQSGTRDLAYR